MSDSENSSTVERPNLAKRSILFATALSTVVGALIGAGAHKIGWASGDTMTHSVLVNAILCGGVGFIASYTRNKDMDQVRPYVEMLEQQKAGAINALTK